MEMEGIMMDVKKKMKRKRKKTLTSPLLVSSPLVNVGNITNKILIPTRKITLQIPL